MIQKPNIKYSDRDKIPLKNNSPNSHFFPTENQSKKSEQQVRPKQGSMCQSRKIDCNLGYRDPIWMIQKPNIKFTDAATIYMRGLSPNSPFC